jgi:hypothetical protein
MASWQYFYNNTTRKYIIMFGNMFNDINVVRSDSSGNEVQTIRVPIAYGPAEKFLTRINSDPSLDREVAIQLPRLAFELTAMTYAPNRGLNKTNKATNIGSSSSVMRAQYSPIPYDFEITLYGMFANNEDAVQVNEQILPFFRPEWTSSLKLIPEIGDYYDIPTVLTNMSIEDTYEGDFETRRAIIYTWNFTVKGYLFGPVSNKGVIKRTVLDLVAQQSNNSIATEIGPHKKIILTPGQYANGSPTANSAASVSYLNISANSTWDYAFDSYDYFDGKNRHDH